MSEENRKHLRLPVESVVFIELVSPRLGSADESRVAICKTLDVSRGGLSVSLDQELTVGAILQIGVELPGSDNTLYLAGEVRWCKRSEESSQTWCAGFELMNAHQSDIDSWTAMLTEMEN